MKEPLSIPMKPNVFLRGLVSKKPNAAASEPTSGRPSILFKAILGVSIAAAIGEGGPSHDVLPPDKEQLQQLIAAVQRQMNDYLFNTIVDDDEEDDFPGLQYNGMNLSGTGDRGNFSVSKIERTHPKTETIQPKTDIDHIIDHASKTYHVAPELIKAVIKTESDFDPHSTSSKGAKGLMQLMPDTARELGVKNCYNPVENIMGGTRYLKTLLDRYDGDIPLALAAYNWGMGNVERHPGRLPQETRTYIARISKLLNKENNVTL